MRTKICLAAVRKGLLSIIACLTFGLAVGLGSLSFGAIVGANGTNGNSNDGNAAAFDAESSAVDLINVGQPTLTSATASEAAWGGYTFQGMHDGTNLDGSNRAFWIPAADIVATYTLNTAISPLGYDITGIKNIQGHTDSAVVYANQDFDIYYNTVTNSTFTLLTSVSYFPTSSSGAGSSIVRLTDTTGVLASGVAQLQFRLPIVANGQTAVYRETDVFGVPTIAVPEPSSLALIGLGCLGLMFGVRRRACKIATA